MTPHYSEQYGRLRTLLDRPIAFNRAFVTITGGVLSGLMLAQAFYWHPRSTHDENWFYKTQAEWKAETGMSRWEQETARKKLRAVKSPSGKLLWEEDRRGVPAKLWYRINLDALEELLFAPIGASENDDDGGDHDDDEDAAFKNVGIPHSGNSAVVAAQTQQSSMLDSSNQECGNPAIKNATLPQTITETTAQTTSETPNPEELINYLPAAPEAKQQRTAPETAPIQATAPDALTPRSAAPPPPSAEDVDDKEFAACVKLGTHPEVGLPVKEAKKLARLAHANFDRLFEHVFGWKEAAERDPQYRGHGALFQRVKDNFNEKSIEELGPKQVNSDLYLAFYEPPSKQYSVSITNDGTVPA